MCSFILAVVIFIVVTVAALCSDFIVPKKTR